jgi:formylglycine-generating enzyme required for sulfatase activity
MGCHGAETGELCQSNEVPVHDVHVDSFYMGVYEITNQQYCVYLNSAFSQGLIEVSGGVVAKACDSEPYCGTTASSPHSRITWDGSSFGIMSDKEDHPMVMVSWYGAAAYCNWWSLQHGRQPCYDLSTWECNFEADGFRLSTEAEWEYAARGGEHDPYYAFPWGNDLVGSQGNHEDSGDPYEAGDEPWTTPVGFYNGQLHAKADFGWPGGALEYQTTNGVNGYGLYDTSGNVSEWCNDWYGADYYEECLPYVENPHGPVSGINRVLRSGSWHHSPGGVRTADRNQRPPYNREFGHGFRVAAGI